MARTATAITRDGLIESLLNYQPLPPSGSEPRLLDAALELLEDEGLRNWTMDELASKAKVGRTTAYRHFASRDEVITAALAYAIQQMLSRISFEVANITDITERITTAMVLGILEFRSSALPALMMSDPDLMVPLLAASSGPLLVAARAQLASMAAGINGDREPEIDLAIAETLLRLAISLAQIPESVLLSPTGNHSLLRTVVGAVLGIHPR